MGQIYMRFPGGKAKALTLSYDDGVETDIRLIEIMNSHGLRGTFNLNSGCYAPEGKVYPAGTVHRRMSRSAVTAAYSNSGQEVAVHGLTHPFLEKLTPAEATYEIIKDRENLEAQFGKIVRGMAYPYGTLNDTVVEILKNSGIAYSRTVVSTGKFDIPNDWLRLPATCHHNDPRLMDLARRFVNETPNRTPYLFYLWGHSYEFDGNNNWNVIEEFADFMGGRDDVWYATNIEIYDYVKAYESLVSAVDGHTFYNPSCKEIFFIRDGKNYSVAPGETVKI